MASFPIRLELKSEFDGLACSFTIMNTRFDIQPVRNDVIDFTKDNWRVRVTAVVQYVYHCVGDNPGSIVCCKASFPNSDEMIAAFEQFKTSTQITDIDSGARPPSYYPAYRLIANLWGKTNFSHGSDHPSALAELIRAACMAGLSDKTAKLNSEIELIHKLIIEDKQMRHNDSVDILLLMREWDRHTGLAQAIMSADEKAIVEIAADLFSNLRSIPTNKLPVCISTGGQLVRR